MKQARQHTRKAIVSGLAVSLCIQTVQAQEITPEDDFASRLSFSAGFDVVSQYYFRGIIQEDQGFIFQPWGELGITLYEYDDVSFGVSTGMWNSFHGDTSTSGTVDDTTEHWYESDLYFGANLDYGKLSFGITHLFYTSPSNAFGTVSETDVSVSYDDSGMWSCICEDFALSPSITLAFESGDNAADGGDTGTYFEFGIEPSFPLESSCFDNLTLSFPAALGLSVSDYYEDTSGSDETFGFLQVGTSLSLSLPVRNEYGIWSLTGGVHVLMLGDATKEMNNGDGTEFVASIGIGLEY
ncbi:MAG: hypothetical protein H6815_09580 [Phycisphaeraceae bacterium]|nr:hypothetical protein [Phycisphaerales bacterium]MCB9860688.1 hypothetical protein [Phycisphaeraceae bacterium]